MMAVNQQRKAALKRLKADLDELTRSPIAGIAAAPLDDDMLEWHCNILLGDVAQHLILFFPEEYPCRPPSAEFVPRTFHYGGGATKQGKKGTQICMPMFSDYQNYHTEWEREAVGWSPGHTVQTCLLGALSFLSDYGQGQKASTEEYTCTDCGHSSSTPHPRMRREASILAQSVIKQHAATTSHPRLPRSLSMPMLTKTRSQRTFEAKPTGLSYTRSFRWTASERPHTIAPRGIKLEKMYADLCTKYHIVDYISKRSFKPEVKPISNHDIYGYGLSISCNSGQNLVASPCEIISAGSFYLMKKSHGFVHSISKQKLTVFLPLYLCANHSSGIKDTFEQAVKDISSSAFPDATDGFAIGELILRAVPMLFDSLLQEASSDSRIQGCFAIHRLLLWAVGIYKDLQDMLESQIQHFIENGDRYSYPDVRSVLMLAALSKKYRWKDIAKPYLEAFWQHQLRKFLKWDYNVDTTNAYRDTMLRDTSDDTLKSRRELAVKVAFVSIAMPGEMSRDEVIARYDENLGFPTDEMVAEMKKAIMSIDKFEEHTIYDGNNAEWFEGTEHVLISDILKKIPASKETLHLLTLNDSWIQGCFTINHLLLCAIKIYLSFKWETLETQLKGYYWIRQILLWVTDTNIDLREKLESQIQEVIEATDCCSKKVYPDIRSLLMLVAVSKKYKWQDISRSYMSAFWQHQLNEFLILDNTCGKLTRERKALLTKTLNITMDNMRQLSFQVSFLDILIPGEMSRDDIITWYDVNLGFPTESHIAKMKNVIQEFANLDCGTKYSNWVSVTRRVCITDIPKTIPELLETLLLTWLSESRIQEYFTLHHLLLLTIASDHDMQELIDNQIKEFIDRADYHASNVYHGLQTLMLLLTVSAKYRWQDIAEPYMVAFWRSQSEEYVKRDSQLGILTTDMKTRLNKTRIVTLKSRKQLAFQVSFLEIVMPLRMSRDDVIARYLKNIGFPTDEMVSDLKHALHAIDKLERNTKFADWFSLIKIETPSDIALFESLKGSVHPRTWDIRRSGRLLSKRTLDITLNKQGDNSKKARK